jgi:putative spermidine/putrescine transport system ATP-binding protein
VKRIKSAAEPNGAPEQDAFLAETVLMAKVEFRNVSKSYAGVTALDGINLSIEAGEFITLLGPSGSGKTTLLNVVSGMITPTSGTVLIDGQDITHVQPKDRGLGMVFQNYALMPHMTVFENVAFPLRIRKLSRAEIEREVMAVLDIVRLRDFAKRKPKELSGGQQQRVSIARCLVYKPKLILMDEPLGALDKKLRLQLQLEIKKIHEELGVTVLYVTHDQEEALILSDRICVMNHARIEQVGTPDELYFRPRTEFVADFLGESNLIGATVDAVADGVAAVTIDGGARLRASARGDLMRQERVKILVRPEAVRLAPANGADGHGFPGVVQERIFVGQVTKYLVAAGGLRVMAQLNSSASSQTFAPGDPVWIGWSACDSIVLDRAAGEPAAGIL